MEPIFVSVEEATHILGLGKTGIYELMDDGSLISVKSGARRLIYLSSIKAHAESLRPVTISRHPPETAMGFIIAH
jgi:excisionase family DNA binding protein